jgi:hypothetical protein
MVLDALSISDRVNLLELYARSVMLIELGRPREWAELFAPQGWAQSENPRYEPVSHSFGRRRIRPGYRHPDARNSLPSGTHRCQPVRPGHGQCSWIRSSHHDHDGHRGTAPVDRLGSLPRSLGQELLRVLGVPESYFRCRRLGSGDHEHKPSAAVGRSRNRLMRCISLQGTHSPGEQSHSAGQTVNLARF